jgi:hypothetical protein
MHSITTALMENKLTRPRLHPNGFIQLDLDAQKKRRLHVWPDKPVQAQKTRHPVHDHAFNFISTLLCGSLTNLRYYFMKSEHVTTVMHRAVRLQGGEDTILQPEESGYLGFIGGELMLPGQTYSMVKDVLHDSIPHGLTATIIEKESTQYTYGPRVAVPVKVTPDNDFRRETVNEDLLWALIDRAVRRAAHFRAEQVILVTA